jgi:hypothetical protein
MSETLPSLEAQRSKVLRQITELGDLRPGSITGTIRRCGKPTCHCARATDPGHGPNLRLTFKTEGKTVTEALPPSVVRKAEREIEEFRQFQKLSHTFVQLRKRSVACGRWRKIPPNHSHPRKKNGGCDPAGNEP